jgi:hypothetical protein
MIASRATEKKSAVDTAVKPHFFHPINQPHFSGDHLKSSPQGLWHWMSHMTSRLGTEVSRIQKSTSPKSQ